MVFGRRVHRAGISYSLLVVHLYSSLAKWNNTLFSPIHSSNRRRRSACMYVYIGNFGSHRVVCCCVRESLAIPSRRWRSRVDCRAVRIHTNTAVNIDVRVLSRSKHSRLPRRELRDRSERQRTSGWDASRPLCPVCMHVRCWLGCECWCGFGVAAALTYVRRSSQLLNDMLLLPCIAAVSIFAMRLTAAACSALL